MNENNNTIILAGAVAALVGGAITFGILVPDAQAPAVPTAAVAVTKSGKSEVEHFEDMPSTGWFGIDSALVAPGDTVSAYAMLPDSWTWGGHAQLVGDAVGRFEIGAQVKAADDGHSMVVVAAKNISNTTVRLDALLDYTGAQPTPDAGTDAGI